MSAYNHNNFNELRPFGDNGAGPAYSDGPSNEFDFNNYHQAAGGPSPLPTSRHDNGTAGQYLNGDSNQVSRDQDNFQLYRDDSLRSPEAGPSNFSSSAQPVRSSPPSSPVSPRQELSRRARRVYDNLLPHTKETVGWHPQLDRMLSDHPHFIPTFDFDSAMSMTARDVVNPVAGKIPAAVVDDEELAELRHYYGQWVDLTTLTVDQLAGMGHDFLDKLAAEPKIANLLEQYRYEPFVAGETIEQILPNVGKALNEAPGLLDYYQIPLRKGEEDGEEEDEEDAEMGEDEDEEEDAVDNTKDTNKKERKYLPRRVQYRPYRYMFKSAAEAQAHRTKIRHPAKIAKDIERVEQYGRYYWTRRIYESMINVDLIFDNKTSVIATNFSKLHHFNEDDLEATAHHIFDECITVHRKGWTGHDYNRHDYKRGKSKDVFAGTIEGRLERICGILKHSKAIANDCIVGGNDLLMQTVDNPIHRASTKTANNKGNMERAERLRKQETDRQREKRLAREAAQAEKKEQKRLEKEKKDAEKKAEQERKVAEREAEKQRKANEREAEKQRKATEREQEKQKKAAERAQAAADRKKR